MICGGHFDLDNKKSEIDDLEHETMRIDFWNDEKME